MDHPAPSNSEASLNKIPFIAADVVLSSAAVAVALLAEKPLGVWTVAVCLSALFLGFIFLVVPYILEFSLKLQARNEDLEKNIQSQSDLLEDALGRWDRLHGEVKSIFESSKINAAGYEGLLHRFDQRLEVLDARLLEIERVARVFESGLKDMAERAETLHAQEAQAWESRLSNHRDSIQQTISALRSTSSDSGKLNEELSQKLESIEAQFTKIEDELGNITQSLTTIGESTPSTPSEEEPWTDPSGRYTSMLDRALSGNANKPTLPTVNAPKVEEPADNEEVEELDEEEEQPEVQDSEETLEETPEPEAIDKEAMPILDDDFIDEVIPGTEVEEANVEDVDWPEPDEAEAPTTEPEDAPDDETEEPAEEEAADSEVDSDEAEPASITASILIGIGDKIHVRGEGPGLSPNTGTEMEFVNIGSYRWSHDGLAEPITLEFYLNDEIPSVEGPITLNPGEHIEISPDFP
ncbi:MAG: hypothetical protein ACPGN3_01725 [Opitutales bacterium]